MPTFTASARSTSPSRVDVDVRQFTFVVDEPPSLGGTDLGPNPVELLLASLLGCLNVVVHLVAQERAVHVRSLHLTAEGDLDPALLFGYDIGTRAGFSGIRVHAARGPHRAAPGPARLAWGRPDRYRDTVRGLR